MKVITISLSSDCVKTPPCTFCFQLKIQKKESSAWNNYENEGNAGNIRNKIKNLVDVTWPGEEVTICYEYNGFNLSEIEHCEGLTGRKIAYTMTTMPQVITKRLLSFIRSNSSINAIALSYNSQVVKSPSEWKQKALMAKKAGFKVSCNQLLENFQSLETPREIRETAGQINLLSLKPSGKLTEIELALVRLHIFSMNPHIPVAVDNCLGLQLGYINSCRRGIDFIHIMSDGTYMECCFQDMCFLYKKDHG